MKTLTFTIKFDCKKCSEMVAINGLASSAICNSCQKKETFDPKDLLSVIHRVEGYPGVMSHHRLNTPFLSNCYKTLEPCCPKCEEHFPFDEDLVGQNTQIPCPHCGQAIETFPAPKWVKQELPAVVQLVGAHSEGPESSGVSLDTKEQNLKPVMLNCPNCAAPLRITAEAERTIVCEHCGVDIYLPDGVWRRLHPVLTVHPWSIVYEGTLETALEIVERHNAERRKEREQRNREINELIASESRDNEKKKENREKLIIGSIAGVIIIATLFLIAIAIGGAIN